MAYDGEDEKKILTDFIESNLDHYFEMIGNPMYGFNVI
jgi:hypothetical protein